MTQSKSSYFTYSTVHGPITIGANSRGITRVAFGAEPLKDVRVEPDVMQGSDTVDGMRQMHIHTRHMYSVVMIDDTEIGICVVCAGNTVVKRFNVGNQVWDNFLQIFQRPFFKSFGEDRMVRIAAYTGNDVRCPAHCNAFLNKQSDEFFFFLMIS